jgi:polyisoprenoid-binding protein YceI
MNPNNPKPSIILMKKSIFALTVVVATLFASCGGSSVKTEDGQAAAEAGAGAVAYKLDAASSSVEWTAKKVTGQHNGTVAIKSGELKAEAGKLTAGKFAMDMTAIKVVDITDAETNGKLAGHLNSDDFFATAKNPESTFEIVSVEPIANAAAGAPNYTVKGNLTIKGIAKAITFPATITMDEKELKANAQFDIDRTEWDIKYGSGKFFQDLGDKMINDAFNVKFNIVAKA